MVDEVILKTFKDSHIDCNHIDELIRQISDPENAMDKWKQNSVDLEQANWNNGTTDVNIMDQILQKEKDKQNNIGMGVPSDCMNQMGNMGMPMNGMPMNGMPMNGMPMNGMPMNGMPMNGMPMNNQSDNFGSMNSVNAMPNNNMN